MFKLHTKEKHMFWWRKHPQNMCFQLRGIEPNTTTKLCIIYPLSFHQFSIFPYQNSSILPPPQNCRTLSRPCFKQWRPTELQGTWQPITWHWCRTNETGFSTMRRPITTCREHEAVTPTKKYVPRLSSVKKRKRKRVVYKFSLMFMLISVIFLICYIPKTTIMLLEARNTLFWAGSSFLFFSKSVCLFAVFISWITSQKNIKKMCVCK